MKTTAIVVLIGSLLLNAYSSEAWAATWPDKPYTAVQETTTSFGKSIKKTIWDGRGHGRIETTTSDGATRVAFMDAVNHVMIMTMPGGRVSRIPLSDQDAEQMGAQAANLMKDTVSLGTKMIDGHACQGKRSSLDGFTVETWYDPEIKQNRHTISIHPKIGTTTSHLTSYSTAQPDPALLVMPSNSTK